MGVISIGKSGGIFRKVIKTCQQREEGEENRYTDKYSFHHSRLFQQTAADLDFQFHQSLQGDRAG